MRSDNLSIVFGVMGIGLNGHMMVSQPLTVGVRLALYLPAARLKTFFAMVITLTSTNMLIKGLGGY
ncbi:hypothetical protein [Rhizobium mongolense]|uniref:Uncharacterized protein n=1 Tax=Rhizobium mongolense TaxID=57676 RepID=A0A7W6WFJ8_9HYPH|nr:hypothetical protein [Rhizobium mongolense]MBB4275693.1 hypothetical protein [Rhizobium mongolense]